MERSNKQIERSPSCQSLRGWKVDRWDTRSYRIFVEGKYRAGGGRSREWRQASGSPRKESNRTSLISTSTSQTTSDSGTALNLPPCSSEDCSACTLRSRSKNFQSNKSKHEMARSKTDHWTTHATTCSWDARERSYRGCQREGCRKVSGIRSGEEQGCER